MNLTKHWAALLDDYVIDLAWSPDGTRLAAASASGPVSIFLPDSKSTDTTLHVLPGHEDGANCVAWAPSAGASSTVSTLATGGQDGKVKLWDTITGQHTATAECGKAWVEHIAWRPMPEDTKDGKNASLAVACGRELLFLNPDATIRHRCAPAEKTISAIVWQPAGGCVAAAHFGGVQLWDADDFILQKEFRYNNGIQALVWSPDNRWLVSGNQDPSVHLWIPDTGLELHMSGYESKVSTLVFDRQSRWLATGGSKDACVWNCSSPSGPEGTEPDLLPHEAKVCALAFQNTHDILASASEDGALMLWSLDRSKPLRATVRMPAAATKIAWSPDDRYLAIGTGKGAVYVLECTQ